MTSGPTQTKAQRRAAGRARVEVWLPIEWLEKLDALCDESGFSRAEIIIGMIEAEEAESARVRWRKENPRPPRGRSGSTSRE